MKTKDYDINVLSNNTFSLESLENTYRDLLLKNFSSLYQTQRSLSGITRYDISMKDLKNEDNIFETNITLLPKRYTISIDFEFIPSHLRYRYKTSNLFNTLLNHETIANNQSLFRYNYMVFIDGLLVSTCEIFPKEDKTILSVDIIEGTHKHGITKKRFNELLNKDAKVTIFFIPNSSISYLDTNLHNVNNNGTNGIDLSRAYNRKDINNNSIAFCNPMEDLSLSHPIKFNQDTDTHRVVLNLNEDLFKSTTLRINWYNIEFGNNLIEVGYNEPYFKLTERMPVPLNNMIIFTSKNNSISFNHDIMVKLYYPNIYKIEGLKPGEKALVYYSYKDSNTQTEEKIHNELELYHTYTKDIIQEYTLDKVPNFIKDYKPINVEYSIDHFNDSIYVPNILSYKINNLQKYIDKDPNILTKYLTYQIGKSNKFYMNMSKMDLPNKIRLDTSNELPNNITTFDRPHYVFILRTPFTKYQSYELKLFLDGKYLYNEDRFIVNDSDFFYVYIPTDIVKPDSLLEIERHKICNYDKLITINEINKSIPLDVFKTNGNCLIDDIFIIDPNTNKYIHRSKYQYIMVIGNDELIIPSNSNKMINDTLKLVITDDTLLNKTIHIMVRNESFTEKAKYEEDNKGYFNIKTKSHANNIKGNYRIFRQGRNLPQTAFAFKNADTFMKPVDIMLKIKPEPGELIVTDFSPNNYKVVHFQRTISDKGFVDVTGKLDKPINLKWHDIYLNGIKVHKHNIKILSIGKFIISGIYTLKNLEIVENSRDYEILRLTKTSYSTEDKIWDELSDIRDTILGNIEDIEDTLEDIIKDIIDNILGDRLEFFEFLMKFTFINPNISQITNDIKINFSNILDEKGNMKIDGNLSTENIKLTHEINANKRSEIMNDTGNKTIDEIGGLGDRFAISALYKDNRDNALPGELMCNEVTGSSLLKREDGTIVSNDEIIRLDYHIERAYINCVYLGYRNKEIVSLEFDNIDLPRDINFGENILVEGDLLVDNINGSLLISLDIDTTIAINNIMTQSNLIPTIIINYTEDNVIKTLEMPVNHLLTKPIKIETNELTINSITLKRNVNDTTNETRVVLHSILIIR